MHSCVLSFNSKEEYDIACAIVETGKCLLKKVFLIFLF
jgi:hypothetical protein